MLPGPARHTEYVQTGIEVDPNAEWMRKRNGKRIQLEDLPAERGM